ncbi:MAG: glycosyltransferase [Bacteroidales bacterium]|nr:glycosyltransferase [Bacteroidales bacterium]
MQELNCIFLGSFLYPKGYAATKRKQQFLDYLLIQKVKVRVLITHKLARGSEINENQGTYNGIPYEVIAPKLKKNFFALFFYVFLILKSIYLIIKYREKHFKNVIVVFGINYETLLALVIAKFLGFKIVFDIVEDFSTLNFGSNKINRIKNWILRVYPKRFIKNLADGISVVSLFLKNKYSDSKKNIPVELIPVSASNLSMSQFKLRVNEPFNLLYSGTYGDKDGLDVLFRAVNKFFNLHNNSKLILTGNCPEHIKQQAKEEFRVLDNIVFTGRLEDNLFFEVLSYSNVLLMTRNATDFANAGFPYKLGEYLASGNPVICTKVSDVELYIKDKESAYLIAPDSCDELFEALDYIYNNQEEAKNVGFKGRQIAFEYFNPETNSKIFYTLLLRC